MCYETERKEEMWCCAISVAFFCPPLAVLLLHGCGKEFLLNCILTFLCYIPGFFHAICIIFCPDRINPKKKFLMTEQACRAREKAEYLARALAREEAAARQAARQPSPTPSRYKKMCFKVIRRDELWCLASIVALICPPFAVMMMTGCSVDFLLNCCLTFLLWIPGFIHAYCIIYCPDHIDPNAKLQMTEAAIRWRARKEAERQAAMEQAQGIERI